MTVYRIDIENLSCAGCVGRAQKAVSDVARVNQFTINLATRQGLLDVPDPAVLSMALESLTRAGYPGKLSAGESVTSSSFTPTFFAILLALPMLLIEMSSHLLGWSILSESLQPFWRWGQFLLASLIILGPAAGIMRQGWAAFTKLQPDMNSLVLSGAGSAYCYSVFVLLRQPEQALYFEAAGVICALILLGRWIEDRAKNRAGQAVRALLSLAPSTAYVDTDQGWVERALELVQVGDRVRVASGEAFPTDARLDSGPVLIDQSMLTGESEWIEKQAGDAVYAGCLNQSPQHAFATTSATGSDTALAGIIDLVQRAQSTQLPIQSLINRISLVFVPTLLVLAMLTGGYWWWAEGPAAAVTYAVAVLIIACPCAMGLATPISIVVGMGRAAHSGILFRNGSAMQSLTRAKTIAFDKTGTLTQGAPLVVRNECPTQCWGAVSTMAAESTHPMAMALRSLSDQRLPIQEFEQLSGRGMQAKLNGELWQIGRLSWLGFEVSTDLSDASIVGVSRDGALQGWFAIKDPVRPGIDNVIRQLHRLGKDTVLLSGDRSEAVKAVAQQLGVEQSYSNLMPQDKLDWIERLPGPVVFVGDGINDAPALVRADTGMAVGTGTQIAIESADVLLASHDPNSILRALSIASATLRNIKQNLFWAFIYNVTLIPVAMGVFGWSLSPMLAAAAMAASSIFVVTNAQRLRWA